MHPRGRAEIRNPDIESGQIFYALLDARAHELGTLRHIHLAFDAAQFDRGIAKRRRLFENPCPGPLRAAERRKADREDRLALAGAEHGGRCGGGRETVQEVTA